MAVAPGLMAAAAAAGRAVAAMHSRGGPHGGGSGSARPWAHLNVLHGRAHVLVHLLASARCELHVDCCPGAGGGSSRGAFGGGGGCGRIEGHEGPAAPKRTKLLELRTGRVEGEVGRAPSAEPCSSMIFELEFEL